MKDQTFATRGEKMTNPVPAPSKKRTELKKSQAILVMVIGGILFVQAFFISVEVGSSAHTIKNAVALIGLVVLFVGVYFRPMKEAPQGK